MEYVFVSWRHNDSSLPVEIYSELDSQRMEVRKVEKFREGRFGFASAARSKPPTKLGLDAVPPLHDIRPKGEFQARAGSAEEFEAIWDRATANR